MSDEGKWNLKHQNYVKVYIYAGRDRKRPEGIHTKLQQQFPVG